MGTASALALALPHVRLLDLRLPVPGPEARRRAGIVGDVLAVIILVLCELSMHRLVPPGAWSWCRRLHPGAGLERVLVMVV